MNPPFFGKHADIVCVIIPALLITALAFFEPVRVWYMSATDQHPFLAGFCKFAILATFGESLAQRLLKGCYLPEDFGLLPRALLWGMLGMCITAAFAIFSAGAPWLLALLGLEWAPRALNGPFGPHKVFTAFAVSLTLNTMFAPVLMVAHKIGDMRIAACHGSLRLLTGKTDVGELLARIDWNTLWNLVLYRSLLFFWIPAHTITFLLAPAFRVLFAAALGAVLGLILAWAAARTKRPMPPEVLL